MVWKNTCAWLFSELELSVAPQTILTLKSALFSVIFLQLSVHALLLYFSSGEKKVKKFYSNTIWSFGGRNKTGILLPKLFCTTVRKIVLVIEKNFWNWGKRPRIFKSFEITKTIYSNSKMSVQFLVTECFFNLFLEISHI